MLIYNIKRPKFGLTGRVINGSEEYVLESDLYFNVKSTSGVQAVSIGKGFTFDSATLPRLARIFYSKSDPIILFASAVHDYFYSHPKLDGFAILKTHHGRSVSVERKEIDILFLNLLLSQGFGTFSSYLFYYSVRLFGESHFNTRAFYEKKN